MYRSSVRTKLLTHVTRGDRNNRLYISSLHETLLPNASLLSTPKSSSYIHRQIRLLFSNVDVKELTAVRNVIPYNKNEFSDSLFQKKITRSALAPNTDLIAKFGATILRYETDRVIHAVNALEAINMLRLAPDEAFLYYVSGAFGCFGDPANVQNVLSEMDRRNYPRTVTTMTSLIEAYAALGDWKGVDMTFSTMKALNLNPYVDSISTLLSIYNMNNSKIDDDFDFYEKGVRNYSLKGNIAMTENAVADMRAHGLKPTIQTMNFLLNVYLKNKDAFGAQRVFDEIRESGMAPDIASFNKLIGAYSSTGDVTSAEGVVQAAIEAGFQPGIYCTSYNMFL